jgi:predicted RNase H-like nuclease (RuvC/YqgF family)
VSTPSLAVLRRILNLSSVRVSFAELVEVLEKKKAEDQRRSESNAELRQERERLRVQEQMLITQRAELETMEKTFGDRDREMEKECEALNQKILEYNLRAQDLNKYAPSLCADWPAYRRAHSDWTCHCRRNEEFKKRKLAWKKQIVDLQSALSLLISTAGYSKAQLAQMGINLQALMVQVQQQPSTASAGAGAGSSATAGGIGAGAGAGAGTFAAGGGGGIGAGLSSSADGVAVGNGHSLSDDLLDS